MLERIESQLHHLINCWNPVFFSSKDFKVKLSTVRDFEFTERSVFSCADIVKNLYQSPSSHITLGQ